MQTNDDNLYIYTDHHQRYALHVESLNAWVNWNFLWSDHHRFGFDTACHKKHFAGTRIECAEIEGT